MSDCIWGQRFVNLVGPDELPFDIINLIDMDLVFDSMFEYLEEMAIIFQFRMWENPLYVSVRYVQNLRAILSVMSPGRRLVRALSSRDALARRRIYPN